MKKFSKGQSSKDQIIKLISAAFTLGKSNRNEDAYFISDRGFGVADGVSGWIDYGFSSEAFSNELMSNCKSHVDRLLKSKDNFNKVKRKCSFVSLEALAVDESDDEIDADLSVCSKKEDQNSTESSHSKASN